MEYLYEKLVAYGKSDVYPFHMPGHKREALPFRNPYEIDITEIDKEYSCKVFFGITMPCDHYMPAYSPYDILLIANDRQPTPHENSLIRVNGCLFIAKKKNNEYFSIRDGKFRLNEHEIDEHIGYVACTIRNDNMRGN